MPVAVDALAVATPCRPAGSRRRSGAGTGRRGGSRASRRRRSWCTRCRAAPGSPAGSSRAARCGSARPSRGRRRAAPRSCPCRWRSAIEQADGGPQRVAAADPVPELEHVGGVDAERRDLLGVGRERDEVLGDGALVAPSFSSSQARAVCALVIVSWVVKVLEATMKSVRSGSRRLQRLGDVRAVDVGDEVRRAARPASTGAAPRSTMTGPRSEPPMPMLTTSVIVLPVWPFHSPAADAVGERAHLARARALTSGITSLPSTRIGRFDRLRSATCSTARSSVTLIFSPANIRSRQPSTLGLLREGEQELHRLVGDRGASSSRRTRRTPRATCVANRCGSLAKSSRMCRPRDLVLVLRESDPGRRRREVRHGAEDNPRSEPRARLVGAAMNRSPSSPSAAAIS